MKECIQKLDEQLAALRPEFYTHLMHPLKDSDIDELSEKYNREIPDDLRMLYKWKNGQEERCFEAFANNSTFLPLDEALDIAMRHTAMIGLDFDVENWWNALWIPLFHNGNGSYICYDAGGLFTGMKGQLITFWKNDHDRNVIAPNLETFIQQMNLFYADKNTQSLVNEEYFSVKCVEAYPKKFVV